jgi:hypothetical protein
MKSNEIAPVCMPNEVPMPRIVRNTTSGTKPPGTPLLLSVTANTTSNRIKQPMNFRPVSKEFHHAVTTDLLRQRSNLLRACNRAAQLVRLLIPGGGLSTDRKRPKE